MKFWTNHCAVASHEIDFSFIESKENTEFYTDSKIKRVFGLGLKLENENREKLLLPRLQHSRVLHISRKTYLIHLVMC